MGTRSDIIVEGEDGKFRRIYCHWDGYLSHNGAILAEDYVIQEKCDALMALGDISSLGKEIGTKHSFDDNPPDMCNAYGRDRGETGTEAKVGDTLQSVWPPEDSWTEFTYVWLRRPEGAAWFVAASDQGTQSLIPLAAALSGEQSVPALIKAFGIVIGQHSA